MRHLQAKYLLLLAFRLAMSNFCFTDRIVVNIWEGTFCRRRVGAFLAST